MTAGQRTRADRADRARRAGLQAPTRPNHLAIDLARLVELVESFARQTIVVLGDFVADEFVYGEISRVSREAPVLILRHSETQTLPGGGANAANNLLGLGARILPVSAIGDDAAGDSLGEYFLAHRRRMGGADAGSVDTGGLVRLSGWTTPTKTRFLAGWTHTTRQQVLRMDREPRGEFPPDAAKSIVRAVRERIEGCSAIVVSDYGYGSATPAILRAVLGRGSWPAPAALDSRYRLHEFAGLRLTAATPNEAEIEAAHHAQVHHGGDELSHLERLARKTMARMGMAALVVTRGRDGMEVFERGRAPRALPVFGGDQAVDVTGAGDTVIAVFALGLAAGADILEAAQLANYAGGIVVMKRGTATVTREELLAAISRDMTGTGAAETSTAADSIPDPDARPRGERVRKSRKNA